MNKILYYTLLSVSLCFLASCTERDTDDTPEWGAIEAFDDFMFKKYEPQMMVRTLTVEANQDAVDKISEKLCLALVDHDGDPVDTDMATLFVDGIEAENNVIEISPTDSELEVGIMLNKGFAQSGSKTCSWRLKVKSNPGYERINEFDVDQLTQFGNVLDDVQLNVKVRIDHKANSARVTFNSVLLAIAGVLALWFCMLRPIFCPKFKVARLNIRADSYYKSVPLKGHLAVVFTKNKKLKQGLFSKLFKGSIYYVYDQYWDQDIRIEPGDKKTVTVTMSNGYVFTPSKTFRMGQEYEMTKPDRTTAKIILQ